MWISAQGTVEAGASPARRDRRAAFPVDPPAPPPAALPPADRARRLYPGVTAHPVSSTDDASRGRYR